MKGGTAAHGLAALCEPIVNGYAAGKSGLDSDLLQHLIDLGDRAEAVQRLEAAALALVRRLEALGFGDEHTAISGADAIDAINDHFPSLREALALVGIEVESGDGKAVWLQVQGQVLAHDTQADDADVCLQ